MNPFLSEPVGSPPSSPASGSVTSAQTGDFLWAETMVRVPCGSSLSHELPEASVGWAGAGGRCLATSLLPGGTWVTAHLAPTCLGSAWSAFGRNTSGTFCLLTPKTHLGLCLGICHFRSWFFSLHCLPCRAPCRSPPVPPVLLPRVVPGWWCRVCSALRTPEPVPFCSTDWGAGCGTGRDRNS